jgi:L-serine kinase (ATP) / ParB family transcriptional regulator, heme-responsive regulator
VLRPYAKAKKEMDPAELRLRIVPLANVILHEGLDPAGVARLCAELRADGILRHPPIVTEADAAKSQDPCYIVLDGATRISALRLLGCRDVLVQIVDYSSSQISLLTWHHLLQGIAPEELLTGIRQLRGIELQEMDARHAEGALAVRHLLCYLILRDHSVWGVKAEGDLSAQTRVLNGIVSIYWGRAELYRVVTTELNLLLREYPDLIALVVFPRYTPAEVSHLALNNAKLPMGITRHLVGGRALNVSLDLRMLASDESLAEKNAWLQEWLLSKIHTRKVRFYGEPLFVFEE